MLKIDHIGIAVKNLSMAREVYSTLMNEEPYKKEWVESEKVTTLFYRAGDTKIELLESTEEDSAIRKYIEKRGEGIHHIAFEVPDLKLAVAELKAKGFSFVNETPSRGADNKLIVFIKPRGLHGVLIELCQSI
ncbi:MAG: methylmalonyl-CoA epimerase [Saprospiraceae bacterium]|nr:methylmalonyl-CoA epimerase [Saprospiraceae bacterium]